MCSNALNGVSSVNVMEVYFICCHSDGKDRYTLMEQSVHYIIGLLKLAFTNSIHAAIQLAHD